MAEYQTSTRMQYTGKNSKECRKWNDLLPGHRMRTPLALPIVTIVVAERRARANIPISNHNRIFAHLN